MDKVDEKLLENPKDLTITYREKKVKIGELSEEEKIDCISQLWHYKQDVEDERGSLQEMIQKMYLFGKMGKIVEDDEEKNG
jgi:hypothetical protein